MWCLLAALSGTGVVLIGTVLSTIAVAVPYWALVKNKNTHEEAVVQGLFEICYRDTCVMLDSLETVSIPDDLIICRVANITGIVLGFLACLISLYWLLKIRISSDKNIWQPSIVFATSVLAAVLIIVTLIIYGVQLYHPANGVATLGYAIYLNAVGAFLLLVGGTVHRVAAGRHGTSYLEHSSEQTKTDPSGPLFFYNLQQDELQTAYRGLVYQQPQATILEPPLPYMDYTQEEHTYVAHLRRDLPEEQYTPGEKRKAASGSSSI